MAFSLAKKTLPSDKFVSEHCTAEDLRALPENIARVKEQALLSMDRDQGRFVIE